MIADVAKTRSKWQRFPMRLATEFVERFDRDKG